MSTGKAIGLGCGGLIVLFGLIFGVIFWATSGITDTADEFFAAVKDDNYEAALELTSTRLREESNAEALEEYVTTYGLTDVVETSWSSRSIANNTGEVSGTVETASGATIPIGIKFVSEGDNWRIDGFILDEPGL